MLKFESYTLHHSKIPFKEIANALTILSYLTGKITLFKVNIDLKICLKPSINHEMMLNLSNCLWSSVNG